MVNLPEEIHTGPNLVVGKLRYLLRSINEKDLNSQIKHIQLILFIILLCYVLRSTSKNLISAVN